MDLHSATNLLHRMEAGDAAAADSLYATLYDDLRRRALGLIGRGGADHTLGATGVVHEAWVRVARAGVGEGWNGRKHFLGVAAKAMRSVLVDHARARGSQKRGGDKQRVVLDEAVALFEARAFDLIALDEALADLGRFDGELARLVELRFFAGLSIAEVARVLSKSTATVERNWRTRGPSCARPWTTAKLPRTSVVNPPDSISNWERVRAAFEEACDMEPAGRAAFLARLAGDDAELERQVRALLAADRVEDAFLEPVQPPATSVFP